MAKKKQCFLLSLKLFIIISLFILPTSKINALILEPVGKWQIIDAQSSLSHSIIEIGKEDGKLYGVIDDKKLFWDVAFDGQKWSGGYMIDSKTGEVYQCQITMSQDAMRLYVRRYKEIASRGQSEIWQRVG